MDDRAKAEKAKREAMGEDEDNGDDDDVSVLTTASLEKHEKKKKKREKKEKKEETKEEETSPQEEGKEEKKGTVEEGAEKKIAADKAKEKEEVRSCEERFIYFGYSSKLAPPPLSSAHPEKTRQGSREEENAQVYRRSRSSQEEEGRERQP